jgi:hypothetical protein
MISFRLAGHNVAKFHTFGAVFLAQTGCFGFEFYLSLSA